MYSLISFLLTYADSGQEDCGEPWGRALREEGFSGVLGEREGDDGDGRGADDEYGDPEEEEGGQVSERLEDVGVVASGAGDAGAELGVAQGAEDGEQSGQRPDDQRHPHGLGVDEDSRRRDEDAGADDGADDDGDAVPQRYLSLEDHLLLRHGRNITRARVAGGRHDAARAARVDQN